MGDSVRIGPLRAAYVDEPTWYLLAFIACELLVVIVLLAVLVAAGVTA
jgi:hypothetical protein